MKGSCGTNAKTELDITLCVRRLDNVTAEMEHFARRNWVLFDELTVGEVRAALAGLTREQYEPHLTGV